MTTKEDRMKSYERYEEARIKAKIKNDATVAGMVGVHQAIFSDWKKGRSQPNAIHMMQIAMALKVPVERLLKV